MLRWSPCLRWPWWRQTGFCVRYAGKGFRETRTFSFTGGGTTSRGSWGRGAARNRGSACMCARKRAASITTLRGRSVIWRESRSTSAASTARRSGSAASAQSGTQCSRTGRLIRRHVEQESTAATHAVPSSPGDYAVSNLLSVLLCCNGCEGLILNFLTILIWITEKGEREREREAQQTIISVVLRPSSSCEGLGSEL